MELFTVILEKIDHVVWGMPLIILIMGTGIYLTVRLRLLQFRSLGKAFRYIFTTEQGADGEVSSFGALCTALAATIGTGNIVGIATAMAAGTVGITMGGPGAVFWMVIAACFGMATKYAEGLLAVRYREKKSDGKILGGPFRYIEEGMGTQWRWLAKLFAVFGLGAGLLGIGTITQVNGIASAVKSFFDPHTQNVISILGREYSVVTAVTAAVAALVTGLVVIGGLQRIAKVTSVVVPFMALTYVGVCLAILIYHFDRIPEAIVTIVESAFGIRAAAGGAAGSMMIAMQRGIARGIFSNEAGLGSAPIAAAAAKTEEPVRQGLVSMTGTFIDTVVICSITGLTIMVTGAYDAALDLGLEGAEVTSYAFSNGLPWPEQVGTGILMVCLTLFAFTTILGWDYYSEKCLEYLSGGHMRIVRGYKWLYITAVLAGPFLTVSAVWTLADIFNGLMAIPNLIALLALSGVTVSETKSYFQRLADGSISD